MWRLLVVIVCLTFIDKAPAEVTHEEIRGTIQSLIYSYNQLDNKLERHEHRTRALGELLKKAMQTLQKGQKNLEPLNGIFARLDERVSQIETMLITQEEKYNLQTEKLGEALATIFKWMGDNDECLKRPPVPLNGAVISSAPQISQPEVPNEFIKQQQEVNKKMLDQIQLLSSNVEKLLSNTKDMMKHTEVTFKSVPSTAEMLTKIEDKLISYNEAIAVPGESSDFQNSVLSKFGEIVDSITDLRQAVPKPSEGLTVSDRSFIKSLSNETLGALELVKSDARTSSKDLDVSLNKIISGVNSSKEILQNFYGEVNASFNKFNEGLEIFNKFNNILMTNSEYVLEIQRKVEFGTLQTVQKISDLIDKEHESIKERFDKIDENILNVQIESVQNLTSVIESEISQVWHTIEIMNGEIGDSKDLLHLVEKRNEVYVNNSFSTMDGLSSKVEETKARMLDMDSNLNFLLGKLSVMSQEFKNIKVGLAESLDELRRTFQSVSTQQKVLQGPGPHTIDKNEYETELNLLNKRHAAQTENN